MKILVTGGAGFLGSHLCELLLDRGHEVICMDNLLTGKKANILPLVERKEFTFREHDVTKYIKIEGPLDYILHFASPASPRDYLDYPIQTLKVGALGTHNALGLAREKGARILLASTSEVYGDPLKHPQDEEYWGNVNPIGPRGVYDESKRFAEAITMAYHRFHGVECRIARIFNTYGPRMRLSDGRAIPAFFSQALRNKDMTIYGDGRQTRSFCFYTDLIDGIYRLLHSEVSTPVNLGNPHEVTILELAEMVKELTGSRSKIAFEPLPQDDPKVRRPDIDKARRLLQWEPKVGLQEGLSITLEYMKEALR